MYKWLEAGYRIVVFVLPEEMEVAFRRLVFMCGGYSENYDLGEHER